MNSSLPGSTDNLYPISEAARILGIHPSTLRLWESQGLISPDRTPGGDRRYRLGDLQDLLSRKSDGRLKENGGGTAPEERSYTISEAAQFLGVHPSTLRLWEERRLVTPARTAGGDRRFSFRQLEDILRRQARVAEPAPRSYENIKVRQLEHYQLPSRTRLAATRLFILVLAIMVSWFVWSSVPDLTRERIKRAFAPDIANPIVDVNDALEYVVENGRVGWLRSKFPFLTDFLKVSQDALFNTARFLGTVFFGEGSDYFISPTGEASFAGVTAAEISVSSLNVENLTVTGTTTGVTGGGGTATGGDADTLEGQSGSYYLDLGNEIGTCANCLTTTEIDESTLSISAANADTLDLLDSTQFLRSDVNDSFTAGTLTFSGGTTLDLQGTILNSTGSVTFTDDVDVLGDLTVSGLTITNGDVTLGDTAADTITFTGVVSSDILPSAAWDIGSAALRWDTGYFDTIDANFIAGTITGSGTNANSWTVNQDNLTANAETSALAFETGTGDFNAVLQWNAAGDPGKFAGYDDNFLFNYPLSLFSQVSGGNQTFTAGSLLNYGQSAAHAITQTGAFTGVDLDFSSNITVPDSAAGNQTGVLITLLDGGASATAIGFQTAGTLDYVLDLGGLVGTAEIRLSNGETIDNLANGTVTVTGDLTTTGDLTVTGNNISSSTGTALTLSGSDVEVVGDLTVTGGEIFLNPITSSGSTTEGTIYYDSDNDKLYVYADGAFQRLATDMTKYTATDAALANAGYVEIAHNQSTNDLSLTAWYYDSLLGQYRTIENFTKTWDLDLSNEFNSNFAQKSKTDSVAIQFNNDNLGNGTDGAITVSSSTNINTTSLISGRSCADGGDAVNYSVATGGLTSTTATLTTTPSSGCLAIGDEIILINLEGTNSAFGNVGNWETLRIQSVSTNVVTFTTAKTKYYGDGAGNDTNLGTAVGTQRVMLQRVPNYTNVTVNTGINFTPSAWNGTKHGVMFFRASGTVDIQGTGTINANTAGYRGGQATSNSGGYGGEAFCGLGGVPNSGNGAAGAGAVNNGTGGTGSCGGGGGGNSGLGSTTQGGSGGGGQFDQGSGGGGGYGTVGNGGGGDVSGQNGGTNSSGNGGSGIGYNRGGGGGGTFGAADLSKLFMGTGGGGGSAASGMTSGAGGSGGGIVYISASTVTVGASAGINSNGGAGSGGSGATRGGGGGAAGGSVRLAGNTLTLGTTRVTATGAAGGSGSSYTGGTGGSGRIATYTAVSLSGTTSPAYTGGTLGYQTYAIYVSREVHVPGTTSFGNISWTESLDTNGEIQLQTRTGNSTDSTDGTWEQWRPVVADTNRKVLESADTHTNWIGTNATVADGDTTRNVDYFEDEDEPTAGNLTKITSSTNGGYAEATISSTDISGYDYITLWVRSSQAGNTLRFGFGEAAATEQTEEITVDQADVWQKVYWDISDITGTTRDAVIKLRLTNLTSVSTTIYLDNATADTYLTTAGGSDITSTANNYIQYRAILSTTNVLNKPTLSAVRIGLTNPDGTFTIDADRVRLSDTIDYYPRSNRLNIAESNLDDIKDIRTEIGLDHITQVGAFDPGTGTDGSVTVSSNSNINTNNLISGRSCADGGDAVNYSVTTLTSTTATLSSTPSAGCLAVGDEVLLINLQGTVSAFANTGNFETLRISNINANIITFTKSKVNYYGNNATDDTNIGTGTGNQRVMFQRVPNYTNVTVNSSINLTSSAWNGTKNGMMFFRATGAVAVNGTVSTNALGYRGGQATTNSGGYGGEAFCGLGGVPNSGNGAAGAGSINTGTGGNGFCGGGGGSNGLGSATSGGSGGGGEFDQGTGGGGGYGTAGAGGGGTPAGASGGTNQSGNGGLSANFNGGGGGGGTYGTADLSKLFMGTGGGGGSAASGMTSGTGGTGGGITYIAANSITVSGSLSSNGSAGGGGSGATRGGGGGGSGGSVYLAANTINTGASLTTAIGAAGGSGSSYTGGTGGSGRIATRYSTSFSGSTSPVNNNAYAPNYPYSLFISDELATPNAVGYTPLTWLADLNTYGMVQVQTRTGKSNNSTDGTWEDWSPAMTDVNRTVLQSMDTHTDWTGTNMTVADGDVTRNVNYFEDEDESTVGNLTKLTSSTSGGYAELTSALSPAKDISDYDYITFWVRTSQPGNTVRFGFGESAATENTEEVTIDATDTWQKVYWDITDVPWDSRDAVTQLRITNLTTSSNTIYLDNVVAERLMADEKGSSITSTPNDYTQYRVVLTTTNTVFRPTLYNVNFSYQTGYKTVQVDTENVRLYNYTGETQNVRLEAIVFGADLAEWYPIDDNSIEAGDVVSIAGTKDDAGIPKIQKATPTSDPKMIGIISTRAGLELGIPREDRRLVGLAGRVPVKIAPDSVAIQAGDLLTSSGTYPGMAQKLTQPGFAVAKALESWDPGSGVGKIDAFLAVSWADPGVVVDDEGDAAEVVEDSNESDTSNVSDGSNETETSEPENQTTEQPITQKIIPPQIEAEEGIFQRLTVAVEAIFEKITAKTAEIAQAFIDNLTARFIKTDVIEAGKVKVSSPAVGVVTIPAGETVFLVEYQEITLDSKVFVTPEEPLSLGVAIKEGEGFEIKLREPLETDLKVSYWVIN